jgi:hypothetical protein
MLRLIKSQFVFVVAVVALAACAPTTIVSSVGIQPTPVVEEVAALPVMQVHDVQMQIGVGLCRSIW